MVYLCFPIRGYRGIYLSSGNAFRALRDWLYRPCALPHAKDRPFWPSGNLVPGLLGRGVGTYFCRGESSFSAGRRLLDLDSYLWSARPHFGSLVFGDCPQGATARRWMEGLGNDHRLAREWSLGIRNRPAS